MRATAATSTGARWNWARAAWRGRRCCRACRPATRCCWRTRPCPTTTPGTTTPASRKPPMARQLTTRRLTSTPRSEEHTSELQSLMRNSYAVFCLKKKYHKHDDQVYQPLVVISEHHAHDIPHVVLMEP